MSLKNKLLGFVRAREWVNGGLAEKFAEELGYKASNASRRLRELVNEGMLDRRLNGRSVEYRALEENQRTIFGNLATTEMNKHLDNLTIRNYSYKSNDLE